MNRASGVAPETLEARGRHVVSLHRSIEYWRETRVLAWASCWPPLAAAMIEIELRAVERELAECVRKWI